MASQEVAPYFVIQNFSIHSVLFNMGPKSFAILMFVPKETPNGAVMPLRSIVLIVLVMGWRNECNLSLELYCVIMSQCYFSLSMKLGLV